ncbi:50S ribosomal protein L13 [Striga asiatica]|uniref:Large ribosomal subunit protein uL13c n=1 Tax=Striga asiatica TaxID=4170 RepID=A0A5A7P8H7_STRAF|nr:50S ribosomal protein L13 [Striga asiatica]
MKIKLTKSKMYVVFTNTTDTEHQSYPLSSRCEVLQLSGKRVQLLSIAMALNCAISSSMLFAKPSDKSFSSSLKKTPFLGISLANNTSPKPPIQLKVSKICCQEKAALVPAGQQWMFDDLTGPVFLFYFVSGEIPVATGYSDVWNKTWYPKAADHLPKDKKWYVVDATDKILGRLASTIAIYIRGKNLATFTPSVDMGAFVIVVNAEKIAVSGKKRIQKLYRRHSGRPGGMKVETFDQLQKRIPERIIEHAVRGMLPKGRLGRTLFTHLKVYAGPDHPHQAQKPIELPLRDKRIQKQP